MSKDTLDAKALLAAVESAHDHAEIGEAMWELKCAAPQLAQACIDKDKRIAELEGALALKSDAVERALKTLADRRLDYETRARRVIPMLALTRSEAHNG